MMTMKTNVEECFIKRKNNVMRHEFLYRLLPALADRDGVFEGEPERGNALSPCPVVEGINAFSFFCVVDFPLWQCF